MIKETPLIIIFIIIYASGYITAYCHQQTTIDNLRMDIDAISNRRVSVPLIELNTDTQKVGHTFGYEKLRGKSYSIFGIPATQATKLLPP